METQNTKQPDVHKTYSELQGHLDAAMMNDIKFTEGNKSASTRARNFLQEIIKIAKHRRGEITAEKNARQPAAEAVEAV
jgi:hypothetical protein